MYKLKNSAYLFVVAAYYGILNLVRNIETRITNVWIEQERAVQRSWLGNMSGEGSTGLVATIIMFVIAIRVFISVMPTAITDASAVTEINGSGESWTAADKSLWNLIPMMMIVFGVMMMIFIIRKRG